MFLTTFVSANRPLFSPLRLSSSLKCPSQKNVHPYAVPKMSGVNGGIDYEIDLSTLPNRLSSLIQTIQRGPDSPTELISAAHEIAAASQNVPATLPVLVDMLGFNNPVAANIAVDALASAGAPAIPSLLRGVAAFNYAVNAYALRALARIGDPSVIDVALTCAVKGPIPNVRRAAVRALGALEYKDKEESRRAFEEIVKLADAEPDWGVRYAALAALEKFTSIQSVGEDLLRVALDVVKGAAEGRAGIFVDGAKVDGDPTVRARAFVTLEVLERNVPAIVGG